MFHPYNNAAKVYKLYFPQKNKRGRGLLQARYLAFISILYFKAHQYSSSLKKKSSLLG